MKIEIKTDFIKLDQLLKYSNVVFSGGEAKEVIINGLVKVNGETENRRGRKIYKGDIVNYKGNVIDVC